MAAPMPSWGLDLLSQCAASAMPNADRKGSEEVAAMDARAQAVHAAERAVAWRRLRCSTRAEGGDGAPRPDGGTGREIGAVLGRCRPTSPCAMIGA